MHFFPRTDFDHSVLVYIKLFCSSLGILDVTTPKIAHAILDDKEESNQANRRSYTRCHRKLRRRIMRLINVEHERVVSKMPEKQQASASSRFITCRQVTPAQINCYLVDVTCMLVDGNLKRADNLASKWARSWKEVDLRKHVNKTYRFNTSKFQLGAHLKGESADN